MRARELKQSKNQLVIFDIDDTLLHTTAKINVIKDGKVVRSLTNQEFNNYQLQPGEEFDFGEFRDARKFEEESVPIGPMLDKLKADLAAGHDVVMLTARADFDNQKAVWRTFKRHGIDINRDVHLYRAGNLPGDDSPALKKAVHVTKWLNSGKYDHVTMYDDSEKNLFVFKGLEKKFPGVEFEAHHVSAEGETKKVEEGQEVKKDQFIEMFKKFLPLAMKHIKLDSLPRMVFLQNIGDDDQPTFGRYVNDEKTLYVALANRHPNDILRTIAHELTHYKQDTEHQLHMNSGETGSEHENEANATAGIVMRHFNKNYPEYLRVRPVVLEGWSDKYKRSINCANPKGFSQRAHCQGRKKHEDRQLDELNVAQTLNFIKQAHGDQLYGKLPYWTHPRAVALTGKKIFGARFNSDAVKTAFLHDVVEDTHIGLDELSKMDFSPQVIEAVGLLTKDKTLTYSQNIEKIIASSNPLAMMVKYADNYENFTGDKSDWDPKRAASSQKKYLMSLNMLGDKLGVKHHIGENFADGRNPQDKGDSKRHKVPTKGKISTLRKIAKQGGRRGQLAHWMANMRSGRAKKKK